VVAGMTATHWIEVQTSWSVRKFVHTARRYGTARMKGRREVSPS